MTENTTTDEQSRVAADCPNERIVGRCSICGEPMPPGEEMFKFHGYSGPCPKPPIPSDKPSLVEVAYGLLWRTKTDDKRVHQARRLLLETLDKQSQERGINAAKGVNL